MKLKIIILGLLLAGVFSAMLPLPASAGFVPCGTNEKDSPPCEFKHLVILIVRVINYLISLAAVVAMYHILFGAFNFITSLGNAEKIETNKKTLSNAVVGFAIVALAFVFVNLLVNGIFGQGGSNKEKTWWNWKCIYGLGSGTENCFVPKPSSMYEPVLPQGAEVSFDNLQ